MLACVVVPTYNERENVRALVQAIEDAHVPRLRLLFVDDSSPDGTAEVVREISESRPWVGLLLRSRKTGIGSAYQDGFRAAIAETDADILIEMDADLQHPPSAIPELIEAIGNGADVALASRYVQGGGISGWGRFRRLVSRVANGYTRFMLGLRARDTTSGLRAYSRRSASAIASANLPAKGFEFQVASLYLLKDQANVVEVPFVFVKRTAGKSKLGVGDMVRFFFAVARMSFSGKRFRPTGGQDKNTRNLGGKSD